MSTPHKHAALIHAWADGAEIESRADEFCRPAGKDEWTNRSTPPWHADFEYRIKPHRWQECIDAQAAGKAIQIRGDGPWFDDSVPNFGNTSVEFRIKPEMLRYRLYKWKAHKITIVLSCVSGDHADGMELKKEGPFLGWLGDWQEVEA